MATDNIPGSEMDAFKCRIDKAMLQVNQLKQKVEEIEDFYSDNNKRSTLRHVRSTQEDAASTVGYPSKRMLSLLRQFSTILRHISRRKWAGPFLEPVDVIGLGLRDYYEIIKKPMDLGTIKKRLVETKDISAYKHVREACDDVRLVFENAMKYNGEKEDIHVMAKSLLAKFEDKWVKLERKVIEEEKRSKDKEPDARLTDNAKLANLTNEQVLAMDMELEEVKELAVQNCRKMSGEEKRQLVSELARLSREDLRKAVEIVARANPLLVATAEEVEIDINALSDSTLWRLNFFVKGAPQAKGKPPLSAGGNVNDNGKRKREAITAEESRHPSKKLGSVTAQLDQMVIS